MIGNDVDKEDEGVTDDLLTVLGAQARAERNAGAADDDPRVQALLVPFEDDDVAALVAGAMAARGSAADGAAELELVQSDEAEEAVEDAADEAEDAVEDVETAANEAPGRSPRLWLAVVPLLVAAALLVLWLRPRPPEGPTLPSYSMVAMQGALATQRSDDGTPQARPRYATDGRLSWTLEPARAVESALAVGILAQREGQSRWLPLEGSVEISAQGVVRIEGEVSEVLGLSAGKWSLRVLIGPVGSLPADAAEAEAATSDDEADPWQQHLQAIEIVEPEAR